MEVHTEMVACLKNYLKKSIIMQMYDYYMINVVIWIQKIVSMPLSVTYKLGKDMQKFNKKLLSILHKHRLLTYEFSSGIL